jgi:hypothetical protein
MQYNRWEQYGLQPYRIREHTKKLPSDDLVHQLEWQQ